MEPIQQTYPAQPAPPITAPMGEHPAPEPRITEHEGRLYSLEVAQQPIRARMCGFGDKDRRHITPPPCIRLTVRDAATEEEIDPSEIDTSFFVLTVDLWSADGTHQLNTVRHSASSPSISTASAISFPPPATVVTYANYPQTPLTTQQQQQYSPYYAAQNPPAVAAAAAANSPSPSNVQHTGLPYNGAPSPFYPVTPSYYGRGAGAVGGQPVTPPQALTQVQTFPTGMYSRNLIGSLSASAFLLRDPSDRLGIWFILQDLSVRTEGSFRLRMNFINLGISTPSQTGDNMPGPPQLNLGSAPVLATVFSDVFNVVSAKKFPGVIESTQLSKCFAAQGIKIPIRKDGVKTSRNTSANYSTAGQSTQEAENDDWEG